MRLVVGALAVATAAACGGSSADRAASLGGPDTSSPPVAARGTPPPIEKATPSDDATYAPLPASAQAMPSAAYAGTASSGPGQVSSPRPSAPPGPTPTPVAGTMTVTDDDSGITVRLHPGQHLRVRLSSGTWDPPDSSERSVVARASSRGGYPSDQPVDAVFDAIGSGTADVTAQSDAACFHTEPRCLMASRQWQVHVVVG